MNPNQWLFYVILPLTIAVVGYASSKLFELVLTRRQQREQMVREHSGHDTAIAQARRAMNLPDEDTRRAMEAIRNAIDQGPNKESSRT
jgi:uncharacterized membrane protein YccC